MNQLTGIYICYWSLMDPLCQTQSLAYIRKLTSIGYRFALITFEQERYWLEPEKTAQMKIELGREGILWFPLTYHKQFPLLATAWDCLQGIVMGLYIRLRYRPRVVHSRASIAAAMALALSKLTGMKFLYDADSRLSEEYADTGYWKRDSAAYRLMSWVEARARKNGDAVIVLSEKLKRDFVDDFNVSAPVTVIPCCVDLDHFKSNSEAGARRRQESGFGEDRVLIYIGKSGPRYLIKEMMEFFKVAVDRVGELRLVILTGDPPEHFQQIADCIGIDRDRYKIMHAGREEVIEWLSAADAGLAFIKSANCERGSSPIKIGEYLAAGLPVVVTEKIGDYSDLIDRERLGVAIRGNDRNSYLHAVDQLKMLWDEGSRLKYRCRSTAVENISLEHVGLARYRDVYKQLCD